MRLAPLRRRTLALGAVALPLLALFAYVAVRSGPLAPVAVTVVRVQARAVTPALFGVGTVEARHTYRIGPTAAGRLASLATDTGEAVAAGQVLGRMDPVDLDQRLLAQDAALRRAAAGVEEARARYTYAAGQAQRYERLLSTHSVSEEAASARRQELQIAEAAGSSAAAELERLRAERAALAAQRSNLDLVAPVGGVVSERAVEPGTTVVAGQSVVELIDPATLWVNVRFDQIRSAGLAAGLPARIVLRSQGERVLAGRVLRVEPKADAITEETLAKIVFDSIPRPLPPLGELAEVTVELPPLPAAPAIPNAAIRRAGEHVGAWRVTAGRLQSATLELGAADLDGYVQVRAGLRAGDEIVAYSEKSLTERSRIRVVQSIAGTGR